MIELLVVVAVLSVLMAILLPALGKARVMAKRTVCQAQVNQIAKGYLLYLHDNEGRFYGDDSDVNANITFGGWRGVQGLAAYRPVNAYLDVSVKKATTDGAKLFRCPADTNALETRYRLDGNSYQANFILVTPSTLWPARVPDPWRAIDQEIVAAGRARLHDVFEPSRLLWIGDFFWIHQWDAASSECTGWHGRRHCHCMAFLDGHGAFTEITRGIYDVPGGYRVQPFQAPDRTISKLQQRIPCVCEKQH